MQTPTKNKKPNWTYTTTYILDYTHTCKPENIFILIPWPKAKVKIKIEEKKTIEKECCAPNVKGLISFIVKMATTLFVLSMEKIKKKCQKETRRPHAEIKIICR